LRIHTAQLLKEPIGSTRHYKFQEIEQPSGIEGLSVVEGQVTLLKTDKGIFVRGEVETAAEGICSRCLKEVSIPLSFRFEEEFFPSIDIVTGAPLDSPEEHDLFTIDEHHILDLTEAVRQYSIVHTPIQPLCRPDCAGLCTQCGADLNSGSCKCPQMVDPRWEPLARLKGR